MGASAKEKDDEEMVDASADGEKGADDKDKETEDDVNDEEQEKGDDEEMEEDNNPKEKSYGGRIYNNPRCSRGGRGGRGGESRDSEDESGEMSEKFKRARGVMSSIAEEMVCPLSLELMVEPVTAEDGHHYERKWIEKTIKAQGSDLRSPMTSEKMGSRLFPSARLANTIESLVESGTIDKELHKSYKKSKLIFDTEKKAANNDVEAIKLLASWHESGSNGFEKDSEKSKKLLEKAEGLLVKKRAEEGDAEAMSCLGLFCYRRTHGFAKDEKLAFKWFKKSSDLKHPRGMASAGYCLTGGVGVEKNVAHGMNLLSVAAAMGLDAACYRLGKFYFKALHGLPKDKAEAKYWLTKAIDGSCSSKHLNDPQEEKVREMLEDIG